jgi:translation initiation factor IF-1
MIETSGVIEKEQGNGFYLVTLEQPAGHQCLCRAAGKLTKFRIKLLAMMLFLLVPPRSMPVVRP